MTTLLLLLLTAISTPAWGQSQGYANRICVDILTNFLDADYTGPVTAGDFWVQNGPRPARGVQILVSDDVQTLEYFVGNDGCITVGTTQTNPLHPFFLVQVISRAEVNGVEIEATDGASYDTPQCANGSNCPGLPDIVSFQVPYAASDTTLTVSNGDQRWNLIAVAMWTMHRNTFGLGSFSSRGCCLDESAASWDWRDGTCVNDPTDQYSNDAFAPYQGATRIEMCSNGSGGSSRVFLVGNDPVREPSVMVNSARRFLIAHELGHVLVEKRMGAFTRRIDNAPLDDCLGDYTAGVFQPPAGNHVPPEEDVDNDSAPGKGAFTKEFQAMAAREGWATYFAVWLFNRRVQSDGQMDWWTIHDLDRDGVVDNNYGDPDTSDTAVGGPFGQDAFGDGIVDMGINPVTVTPASRAALAQHAIGYDWLEHLIVANDTLNCTGTLENRGTEYDWARFFWDMNLTVGGDIRPEDLADLYVDMCPSNWKDRDQADTGTHTGLPWPTDRLERSAVHQGPTVESEWSLRRIWGQDH